VTKINQVLIYSSHSEHWRIVVISRLQQLTRVTEISTRSPCYTIYKLLILPNSEYVLRLRTEMYLLIFQLIGICLNMLELLFYSSL